DASRFALVISTPIAVGDLFVLDAAAGPPRPLTSFNDGLFSELSLTAPEEITYPSFDGKPIQAWIQKPADFDPAKKYPLVLNIHGGPHAAYGHTVDFTLFTPRWFRGAPWEDPADFAARSPITHVAKVTTPLMLIEGEADYRTPPADGGEQMLRALKFQKKPTVMVRFPDESHEL